MAYTDDLSRTGKISDLKEWWALVNINGPIISYIPNAAKSVLIVKPEHYNSAIETYSGSEVIITKDGQRQLGAVIETEEFKKEYIGEKETGWVREINVLSDMAKTELHAAYYSAYTHGLQHRWNFVMRTILGISPLFTPFENAIRNNFLPALLRSPTIGDDERALLEFPPRLCGIGITFPKKLAAMENLNSLIVPQPYQVPHREDHCSGRTWCNRPSVVTEDRKKTTRNRQHDQRNCLKHLKNILSSNTVRKVHNWLTSLPIRAKGFSLNKQGFVDAVALRNGWPVNGRPSICVCGSLNDVNHFMTCKKGGFVCIRHDEVRDLKANMLR